MTLRSKSYDNGLMDLDTYLSQPGSPPATEFAQRLQVSYDMLRQWRHRHGDRRPGPENCVLIEQATNGAVTRKDLRPDDWQRIWPELAEVPSPRPTVGTRRPKKGESACAAEHRLAPVDAPAGPVFMYGPIDEPHPQMTQREADRILHGAAKPPGSDKPSNSREGR